MATRRKPTPEEWNELRPEIMEQFSKRTVRWIVEDLNARGFMITKKMLWDRFRAWGVPRKYNSKQIGGNRPTKALVACPQKGVSMSPNRLAFHDAMSIMRNWLKSTMESGSWRASALERRIDMQRLVSKIHMAIESQDYDTNARVRELQGIEGQARALMSPISSGNMHPRVFAALMRIWILDWQKTPWKQEVLQIVRNMVFRASKYSLPHHHPVAALSRLARREDQDPNEIIDAFLGQVRKRLLEKIVEEDPDFAVREQIYAARALASIGRSRRAVDLLQQTDLRPRVTDSTLADFHSAFGYALMQTGRFSDAIPRFQTAAETFDAIDESNSESAEYAHFCLSMCYNGLDDIPLQEHHLRLALRAWESNATLQNNQGGLKIVLDLHKIYERQVKTTEAQDLVHKYPQYFEEIPEAPS